MGKYSAIGLCIVPLGLCIVPPSGRANTDIPRAEYFPILTTIPLVQQCIFITKHILVKWAKHKYYPRLLHWYSTFP